MFFTAVIDLAKRIPVSTWIALTALAISIVSLYVSIWKISYDRKLESSRKRTELMNKLMDTKMGLERAAGYCKLVNPLVKSCRDRWEGHIPLIDRSIKGIEATYNLLEQRGSSIDSLFLENMTPSITNLLKNSDYVHSELKALMETCLPCAKNKSTSDVDSDSNKDKAV